MLNKIEIKLTLISLLLISTFLPSYGQKYGNIWQFEDGAGIDFNSCDAINITTGHNAGFEGTSCISDSAGQLLFYTNSDTVWNKLNIAMPNGYLINSMGSLSQVIIIPKPNSNSLYYIVTTELQAQALTLQYHTVDMTLNGGLGDVVSKNNILSSLNVTEQIAATFHNNGTDIWLMTHEYGANKFLAYLVTASGISATPIISSVGPSQMPCINNANARGNIKFSPDGTKIAFNGNGVGPGSSGGNTDSTNVLALFDFDNSTGIVSNPINLPYCRGDYGLTFSPDNSKLYGTTWKAANFATTDSNYIYQFDLSSGNSLTIINSKKIIFKQPVFEIFGSINIGPDGKIYVARYQSGYLGVINSPNQSGIACNYIHDGFYLGGKTSMYGLNNYIEYKNYCDGTGINEQHQQLTQLSISPNPSNETFNISLPLQQTFNLQVIDITGRIVYTNKNATGNITIHCRGFGSGVYFLKAVNERTVLSCKLIKE